MNYLFLFDIDGTILKLKQYHSKSIFRKCLKNVYSIDIAEELMPNFSGMTDLKILDCICEKLNIDSTQLTSKIQEFWDALILEFKQDSVKENIIILPEIENLIKWLDSDENYYLGLVTGNFKANAYLKLETFNLHNYFEIGAFGCEYADRNLLPKLAINRANELWGNKFDVTNSIIIGDSPNDIICSKNNSIFSVAVCTGFHSMQELNEFQPDIIYEDFNNFKIKINEIITKLNFKNGH